MQKFLPVKLAVLAAAALLLTGCPTVQKAQEGEVQQQAQASKGKIDTICVVRHQNAQLGNEKLVKAIEAGLQHTGVKTRVVEHNQVPADCRLCLFYGVTTDDKVAKSFDFQAVIDGKALQRGSGPVQPTAISSLRRWHNMPPTTCRAWSMRVSKRKLSKTVLSPDRL